MSTALFIAIDGPSGVGKSTLTRALTVRLGEEGYTVHRTAEPSDGPIGSLARGMTNTADGLTLACLYAADRYHHLAHEIAPRLAAGAVVITDRYVASGLVMQRLDGVDPTFLSMLNEHAQTPDVLLALTADDDVIRRRLTRRGTHNRYQDQHTSSRDEATWHREAADHLAAAGAVVHGIDTTHLTADAVTALAHQHVRDALTSKEGQAA
ncbi:dTMP kinase [Antribacter sp. KLBMP9083]|uniref:Thymidylate kinase n=1 Tax=Antribacter soli TaxID=2910976 RepID=A0AA41QH22_9MICO|nr:dTMP kinase [Antribacter soli]MCF4123007.1 dTMP kinase [Antribacter soli]